MSLIHWWPLNGDTKDRIGGITLTNNNSAVVTTGKIGQCYQFNGTNNLSAAFTQIFPQEPTEFSFAFWIKLNSTWSGWGQVLTIGRVGADWRDIRIGLDIADNKTVYFTISNGSDSTNYSSPQYSSLAVNEWCHITGTFKNKIMHLFINGQLQASYTASFLPLLPDEPIITIGGNGGENGECDINDVRIYDHALSPAEIQELNKALVLHYSFDDVLADGTTNLISGQTINGHGSTWTLLSDDSFYGLPIYRNTVTTPNVFNNAGFNINTSFTYTGPQSTHLCLSFWKRLNVAYSKSLGGYIEVQYTDDTKGAHSWTYNNPIWANDSNSVGQWEQVTGIVDIPPDKTIKLITCLYIYTDHALYGECDFAGIQIEAKDHATPYTPISRKGMLYNETGLTQPDNNTIQNMQLVTDAAIGRYSLKCNNTQILTPIAGNISQGATLSLWINLPKDSSGNNIFPSSSEVVVADQNSQLALGFFNGAHSIITCNGFAKPIMTNLKDTLKNDWNHIAVIRDGDNIKGYLNGIEYPLTGSQEWTHSEPYFSIGCRYSSGWTSYYNGQVDDIRLYHTALSPEEVKELYNCGGRISNLGDAFTGEFIEGAASAKINKNHTIQMNEFIENDEGKASIKKGNILSSRQIIEI